MRRDHKPPLIQSLLGSGKPAVSYAVAANTDEGWLAVANGNQHPAKLLAVSRRHSGRHPLGHRDSQLRQGAPDRAEERLHQQPAPD